MQKTRVLIILLLVFCAGNLKNAYASCRDQIQTSPPKESIYVGKIIKDTRGESYKIIRSTHGGITHVDIVERISDGEILTFRRARTLEEKSADSLSPDQAEGLLYFKYTAMESLRHQNEILLKINPKGDSPHLPVPMGKLMIEGGEAVYVQKYIRGTDLFEHLTRSETFKNLPYKEKAFEMMRILKKAFLALKEMHNKGVIHFDIKADNLIYNPATDSVTIIDFAGAGYNLGQPDAIAPKTTFTVKDMSAPEVMDYYQHPERITPSVDYFSLINHFKRMLLNDFKPKLSQAPLFIGRKKWNQEQAVYNYLNNEFFAAFIEHDPTKRPQEPLDFLDNATQNLEALLSNYAGR